MKQILFLHGGDSFRTPKEYLTNLKKKPIDYERLKYSRRWRDWIAQQMTDHDVLMPTFPNGDNAQYDEWVIYFEKIIPFIKPGYSLVGHSLGAMFLAKYLHENVLPVTARQIVLIAGRYGDTKENGSFDVTSAKGLERSAEEIHLFHSEDDPIVPFGDVAKFHADAPGARIHHFKTRGHFLQTEFPELLELLQK